MIGRTEGHPVDLHTHSLRSDGALEPAALVRLAAAHGVEVMALSDHDTLAGVAEAVDAGHAAGVRVISASELNTESEWGDVHILGYFLDPSDAALERRFEVLREERRRRAELMVGRLNDLGYPISYERVLEIAQGGSIGRPHLATALREAGLVASFDAAFETILAKSSPAYVPRIGLGPIEAVRLVRAHGGVPSVAHPETIRDLIGLLPSLVAAGLAGIECYYRTHTPARTMELLALCRAHQLVATGGSDFHGRGEHGAPVGGVNVPRECVAALDARRIRYATQNVEGTR